MQIVVINGQPNDDNDWRGSYDVELKTNHNNMRIKFVDGEVEDANLSRDFNDVYDIPQMLIEAYEAGRRGESLDVVERELEEE